MALNTNLTTPAPCRPARSCLQYLHLLLPVAVAALICLANSGCSLGVMAGKLLMGDPKQTAPFRAATRTDLTKGKDSLLIICSAPHGILAHFPSIQIDIVERMTLLLETRGVKVISADQVATWFDDHGEWGDFSQLARSFDADYIMNVEIRKFSHRVPDSETLMQGQSEGRVTVSKAEGKSTTLVRQVFDRNFTLTFPTSYPVPRENRSEQIFLEGFLDRLAIHLSQFMYDHRASETVH